jgi:cupin superfamily acireductone dioxygenase involved in methionine salvage
LEACDVDGFVIFVVYGDLIFQGREEGGEELTVAVDDRDLLSLLKIFEFYQKLSNGFGVWTGRIGSLVSIH